MKIPRVLSGAALKHIAMAAMLADHVNKGVIIPRLSENSAMWLRKLCDVFSAVGRFAFPVFLFMLVEGFFCTKNRRKYLKNLLLFGILSEFPYDMFLYGAGVASYWRRQNIYFTLALALCVIWLVDIVKEKQKYGPVFAFLICLAGCMAAELAKVDYGVNGILIPVIFYFFRPQRLVATCFGYLPVYKSYWSLPSFLALNLYNGQRGKQSKWFNYWFYPVHLLVLGIIRMVTRI